MSFSDRVKQAGTPILRAQLEHPFVKGLADGALSVDRFRHYMIQDALYIVEYARAMAWVAPLMPAVEDILAMLDAATESFKIEASLKAHYFVSVRKSTNDRLLASLRETQ